MCRTATPAWYAINVGGKWGLVPSNYFKVPEVCSAARDYTDAYKRARGIDPEGLSQRRRVQLEQQAARRKKAGQEVELTPEQIAYQDLTKLMMCVPLYAQPKDESDYSNSNSPRGRRASRVSPKYASQSNSPRNRAGSTSSATTSPRNL